MKLRVAMLALAASLAVATPAAADTYTVTGSGDNSIPGGCEATGAGQWTCNSLRGAVNESNARPGADEILITAPTVNVSVGVLAINDDLTISGLGARATTVDAFGALAPAFRITGAEVNFGSMTIQGGTNGNIEVLSGSTVGLAFARVTAARSGPGIVNEAELNVTFSLIDGNPGGGIDNDPASGSATLIVGASTVTGNTGYGIRSRFSSLNVVDLFHATIARNAGSGLLFDAPQDASANFSIIANNGPNCTNVGTLEGDFNVEDATTCGLSANNRVGSDPLLAAGLSNQGGFTDVLTIPANSPAADYAPQCVLAFDQRGFQKTTFTACDAGAYDRDAVDPGIVQPPPPPPTPTPQPPAQPTPTPTAVPTPVVNQSAVVREVRGTVKVQLPGSKTFVDLDATRGLPMGSTIDTRKGRVELTSVPKAGAPPEKAQFYDGLFKVTQSRGITTLTLTEELDCPKGKGASAAQKKPKKRKLWGDGKGAFRTAGKYSAATVRGTRWLVEDTCTTTTTRVAQGSVVVQHGKKRIVLRAPKKYVARAKK